MTCFGDLLCTDDQRRAELRAVPGLYGIDFLEIRTAPPGENQRVLELHFQDKTADPQFDNFLTSLDGHPEVFSISGGVRVRNIAVDSATRNGNVLELHVTASGDFSDYRLRVNDVRMDPVFADVAFSFKAGCPGQFDCKPVSNCEPVLPPDPAIDYLAKDYASFRQALLDRTSLINPDWRERRAADFGIAMAELFAYAADHLSYYQDAVATEAYLGTARQRISVRRHARLIDYEMHDGASSRAFVVFEVGTKGEIPAGTQLLSRLGSPLNGKAAANVIAPADTQAALDMASAVFELENNVVASPGNTGLSIYTWRRNDCCLPAGATSADLEGSPELQAGDLLLFEEAKGLNTGLARDADPSHRQVVRLTVVSPAVDPLDGTVLTRVTWDSADALQRPLCLSFTLKGLPVTGVSTASGNVGVAHHGKRFNLNLSGVASGLVLREAPLSQWLPDDTSSPVTAMTALDSRLAKPAVKLLDWTRVDTLLDSDPNDAHFVAEIDNQGRAVLRFGDGVAGKRMPADENVAITYWVGLGPLFDLPANALVHVVDFSTAPNAANVISVRNPLPAWGGASPEPIEDVRLKAPASLRTGLFRAVTEDDYARAAEQMPEVSKAVATFRWTGTWHTVFVTVDPTGTNGLTSELSDRVADWIRRFTQTGYDVAINGPTYVPLEIEITICTDTQHFRTDVYQAVLRKLGEFFNPDRFTFGQPLFLSQVYAAATDVEGVRSARVTKLQRFGKAPNNELENGSVRVGRTEVIRCDNDPNFAERGVLRLNMEGGK